MKRKKYFFYNKTEEFAEKKRIEWKLELSSSIAFYNSQGYGDNCSVLITLRHFIY